MSGLWSAKTFKTFSAMTEWMKKNQDKYQMQVVYVQNGYSVDYRPWGKISLPR